MAKCFVCPTEANLMVRIAISPAAFDAICATLPVRSVAVEAGATERGKRVIWLEDVMADRLGAVRPAISSPSGPRAHSIVLRSDRRRRSRLSVHNGWGYRRRETNRSRG